MSKGKGNKKGKELQFPGQKWNIALINHGGERRRAGDLYLNDMYTIPAWVILCCEMDEATHASMITEVDIWEPAEHPLHLQDPPQGFHAPDRVLRWRSCGLHSGLTVFGKQAYVESLIA